MLNGVAHWIKGSAFIWLGFFTLARWAGAFADIGWVRCSLYAIRG